MATKLYPPIIDGVLPAFCLTYDPSYTYLRATTLTVPFTMNGAVSEAQVAGFSLRLRTVSSGSYLFEPIFSDNYDLIKQEVTFTLTSQQCRKLMEGQYSDFRSINIEKKALGEEKHRNNLLRSIGDYYVNQAYQPLNQYIIDKKYKKNKFLEKDKITKEFDFEKNKVRIALSEKIKRKKDLKNRGNISLNLTSFNGIKLNKKDYQNFYENLNCLTHRVKNTYEHIKKNIEIRQKYRDDINNLFLVYNFNIQIILLLYRNFIY